jgi:hypothetical protein
MKLLYIIMAKYTITLYSNFVFNKITTFCQISSNVSTPSVIFLRHLSISATTEERQRVNAMKFGTTIWQHEERKCSSTRRHVYLAIFVCRPSPGFCSFSFHYFASVKARCTLEYFHFPMLYIKRCENTRMLQYIPSKSIFLLRFFNSHKFKARHALWDSIGASR